MFKESDLLQNNNGMTSTFFSRSYYQELCTGQYYFKCNLTLLLLFRYLFVVVIMFIYLETLAVSSNRDIGAVQK